MYIRSLVVIAMTALVSSCGGGGGDSAASSAAVLAYLPPVAGTVAVYSMQLTDNSNNTINSLQQYSYLTVNPDGSYVLRRDDLSNRTVINGTPYGGYSWGEQFNSNGNLVVRALLVGATPYTCTFSPAEIPVPLPLALASTWNTAATANCTDGRTISYTFTNGSVVGVEDVLVPAGTFRAVHVQYSASQASSDSSLTEHIAINAWIDVTSGRYAKIQQVYSFTGGVPSTGFPISQIIQLASLRIGA